MRPETACLFLLLALMAAGWSCSTWEDPCPAQCEEQECGDDDCGNFCGLCPPGNICAQGFCVNCDIVCNGPRCGYVRGCDCGGCPPGSECVEQEKLCVYPAWSSRAPVDAWEQCDSQAEADSRADASTADDES